jgi:hypothetical protein
LDEENPMFAGLAQENGLLKMNGLGSAYLWTLPCLVQGVAALCTCRKECNNMI